MKREGDPADLRLLVIFLRSLRGWNQRELAEAAGVDKGAVSDYELGNTAPSGKTLRRIVDAVPMRYDVAERLLHVFRAVRLAVERGEPRDGHGTGESAAALMSRLARAAADAAVAEATPALLEIPALSGLARPAAPAEERRKAAALWRTVAGLSSEDRDKVVAAAPGYHTWAFSEFLCEESARTAADRSEAALELAGLARRVAGRVAGTPAARARLLGYCWGFTGNARRVQGDLPGAEEAFLRSARLWRKGESADSEPPLDPSRLFDLEASLRQTQGRFAEAVALLDQALAGISNGETRSRILIKKATGLEIMGRHQAAVEALEEATHSLREKSSPRLVFAVRFNLAVNLLFLGRHAEAELLLPEVRDLAVRLGNGLDLVRVRWLEGRAAAGLGRREEAIAALLQVRGEFTAREIALDAALVSLELAVLYLEEGRASEVKALAQQMLWIFQAQGVPREALASLRVFCEAAGREAATVELARRAYHELERAHHATGFGTPE